MNNKKLCLLLITVAPLLNACGEQSKPIEFKGISYNAEDGLAKVMAEEMQNALKGHIPNATPKAASKPEEGYLHLDSYSLDDRIFAKGNSLSIIVEEDSSFIKSVEDVYADFVRNNYDFQALLNTYSEAKTAKQADYLSTIMSYNVRVGGSNDYAPANKRYGMVSDEVLKYWPSSVGMQEVSSGWLNALENNLKGEYARVGEARQGYGSNEYNPIFYRVNELDLLESGTKWLSPTPDVPGSRFEDSGDWSRILTYALLKRKTDGLTYLHVNTHLDLTENGRLKQAAVIKNFVSSYADKYPVYITGDFNDAKGDGNAVDWLLENGFVDGKSTTGSPDLNQFTFPAVGFYPGEEGQTERSDEEMIIDYCLAYERPGFYFNYYDVLTDGIGGKPTSDHYSIYLEMVQHTPLGA